MAIAEKASIIILRDGNIVDFAALLYCEMHENLRMMGMMEMDFLSVFADAIPDIRDARTESLSVLQKSQLSSVKSESWINVKKAKTNLLAEIENRILELTDSMKSGGDLLIPEVAKIFLENIIPTFGFLKEKFKTTLDNYLKARAIAKLSEKEEQHRDEILDVLTEYVLLLAVDKYVDELLGGVESMDIRKSRVKNRCFREAVWIIIKPPKGLLAKARINAGILERPVHPETINDRLQILQIINSRKLEGRHNVRVVTLSLAQGKNEKSWISRGDSNGRSVVHKYSSRIPENNRIRFGIVVMTGKQVTQFPPVVGTSYFTVAHSKEYVEEYADHVINALIAAEKERINILIFPEYMIPETLLSKIKEELRRTRGWDELWLVAAGTRWTDGNDNRLTVLDRYGNELGISDKAEPFSKPPDKENGTYSLREKLDHPGRNILMLDILGVGRVQFPICKDVCVNQGSADMSLSDFLMRNFLSDLILVPAWSNSVEKGFANSFEAFGQSGAISILCNCCEPVVKSRHEKDGGDKKKKYAPPYTLIGHPVKRNKRSNRIEGTCERKECEKFEDGECRHSVCMFVLELFLDGTGMAGEETIISDFLHRSDL